jgi:hypothetical protein
MKDIIKDMVTKAGAAFAAGELTAPLPLSFDWMPESWGADEIRLARALVADEAGDDAAREFCMENGYPIDEDDPGPMDTAREADYLAWLQPIEELRKGLRFPKGGNDFWLYTTVTGWCEWEAEYSVVPLSRRVAVLVTTGLADSRLPYPTPACLLDRRRLLPAVAEALDGRNWFLDPFDHMSCSHAAADLYRVLLVASDRGGDEVWSTPEDELERFRAEDDAWGYAELRGLLGGDPVDRPESPSLPAGVLQGVELLGHLHMRVCQACGRLAGGGPASAGGVSRAQRCDCLPHDEQAWPGYDFNLAVELCRCCGQVALRSGSRWSVWFCAGCNDLVQAFNKARNRYAIPIGRHSFHGGISLTGEASELDVTLFLARWGNLSVASGALDRWAGIVARRIIGERWPGGGDVPLVEYLAACDTSEGEKRRRFEEMLRFFGEEARDAVHV